MESFRIVLIPQCAECGTAAQGDHGDLLVEQRLLTPEVRHRLTADGWTVAPGDPAVNRGPAHLLGGDRLSCPACTRRRDAAAERALARQRAAFARPRTRTLGMADRLGDGWQLTQREGDEGHHLWYAEHQGAVRGQVRRYRRTTSPTYSAGWEAYLLTGTCWQRVEAIGSCQHNSGSSFLWSGRDLAAWGIAARPAHDTPRPAWATRSKKRTAA
ncbi:hypothetical protein [Streptomyces niveiscabiei]|uniref:hypothetical protein n=1 Tax=Streptomyces niveiscabiei TaxID=164115 RepID=UPI0038F713A4